MDPLPKLFSKKWTPYLNCSAKNGPPTWTVQQKNGPLTWTVQQKMAPYLNCSAFWVWKTDPGSGTQPSSVIILQIKRLKSFFLLLFQYLFFLLWGFIMPWHHNIQLGLLLFKLIRNAYDKFDISRKMLGFLLTVGIDICSWS